jgi:hypothetical protein
MKDGLCGQDFPDDAINTAVNKVDGICWCSAAYRLFFIPSKNVQPAAVTVAQ